MSRYSNNNTSSALLAPIRIGHIGLAVRDLDRSLAFYVDVLGLRLTERFTYPEEEVGHGTEVAAGAFVRCDSAHHCFSLFALKAGNGAPVGAFGLHHIAFELPTPSSLLAYYRRLRDSDVPIVNARRGGPGNQPRFYAHDPDHNLLEFYWGIDQIGWDGRARAYRPIEEIDLEEFDFAEFASDRDSAGLAERER